MIRLFRVSIPAGSLALLISEVGLITSSYILASYFVLPYDPTVFLLYDGGSKLIPDQMEVIRRHKRPPFPPTIWRMDPQIVLLLENRDTVENALLKGEPSPVGPVLSAWQYLINSAVTNDDQLLDLVTANGAMVLSSIDTDLRVGRTVGAYGAWLMMHYEFDYPLFPPR